MRRPFGRWLAAILILLLAAVLAVLLIRAHRESAAQAQRIAALQEEAAPYERRIAALEREIADRHRALTAGQEETAAQLVAGFAPASLEDLDRVAELAERYDFRPLFVIDAAGEQTDALLAALQAQKLRERISFDVVITGTPLDEGLLAQAAAVRDRLAGAEDPIAVAGFLLRSTDDSADNRAALAESGFPYSIRYADVSDSDGSARYCYVRSDGYHIASRISALERSGGSLVVVFELQELGGGLSEDGIISMLDQFRAEQEARSLVWSSWHAAELQLMDSAERLAERTAEFEAFAAEAEQEITALRTEIDAIYTRWNGQ